MTSYSSSSSRSTVQGAGYWYWVSYVGRKRQTHNSLDSPADSSKQLLAVCVTPSTHQLRHIWFIVRTMCGEIAAKLCHSQWLLTKGQKVLAKLAKRVRHNKLPAIVKLSNHFMLSLRVSLISILCNIFSHCCTTKQAARFPFLALFLLFLNLIVWQDLYGLFTN